MELQLTNLGKRYGGKIWGMRNCTLTIAPGILGLLGPNGAGKTTLIRMLATITRPTEGKLTLDGIDLEAEPNALRKILGYLPQDVGIYPNLTAGEFLAYIAAAKGLSRAAAQQRIDDLMVAMNLTDYHRRPLGSFSGGMRQRVGIAAALVNDPRILLLDEPTVGLDPEERLRFRNLLAELSGERVVILSSHIVSDLEAIATEVVIVNLGQLRAVGTPDKLVEPARGKVWEQDVTTAELNQLRSRVLISGLTRKGEKLRVRMVTSSMPSQQAEQVAPSLEDAYLLTITNSPEPQPVTA